MEKLCVPVGSGAPLLAYSHEHGDKKMQTFTTIWPNKDNKSYLREIPELQGKLVQASGFGWLLLQDELYLEDFCLWNPVTLETIALPPLEKLLPINVEIIYNFTSDTDSTDGDDFTVFVFCKHIVFFCHPVGDHIPRWRSQNIEIEGRLASIDLVTPCNGLIYASSSIRDTDGCLLSNPLITVKPINTSCSSLSFTPLELQMPDPIDPKCISYSYYMLESCGQVYYVLFSLSIHVRTNSVDIWELDLDKKIWLEVKSLHNRSFFLGRHCTWCWANSDSQVEANSVFIRWIYGDTEHNTLYKYSLTNRSFTVYVPCPNLPTGLKDCFWFIPRRSQHRSLARTHNTDIHVLHQNANALEYPKKLLPKQNETTESILERLPIDTIELISKNLCCFDYLHFRATCKTFQSILSHGQGQWGKTYNSSLPVFVFLQKNKRWLKVMDSFRNKLCYIAIPESPKYVFSIDYCKDGWLVLYRGGSFFQFFNLFTRTWGKFPPHEDVTSDFMSIGFSTFPTSSDCVIVRMYEFPLVTINYVRRGDKDWKSFELKVEGGGEGEEGNIFIPSTCPPVYRNGGFYFLDKKGCIGVFELVGEEPNWQVYGRPKTRDTEFHSYHLVECDGNLFSVFIGILGKWIQIFRFDDNNKVWIRVKRLGDYAFFISRPSSISIVPKEVGTGNRIYLPRLHDKGFIFYSLETRKYHVVGTDVVIDCFCPSEEPLECCWAR